MKRSFTPMDFAYNVRTSRGHVKGGSHVHHLDFSNIFKQYSHKVLWNQHNKCHLIVCSGLIKLLVWFRCDFCDLSPCFLGDSTPMGVTGFSMSITSSTASGFLDCSTPNRRRLPISSCTDGEGGNMPLLSSIGKYTSGLLVFNLKYLSTFNTNIQYVR